jgi:hypothetical protein
MNYDIAYYGGGISDRVLGMRKRLDSNSISLAIMSPCGDKYWDKKTIYNILSSLRDDGVLAVVTDFDGVGAIMAICNEGEFYKYPCCFYPRAGQFAENGQTCTPLLSLDSTQIIILITKQQKINMPTLIVDDKHIGHVVIKASTSPQDIVLVMGDGMSACAREAKQLCRYVISFISHPSEFLENEGIKMEDITRAM